MLIKIEKIILKNIQNKIIKKQLLNNPLRDNLFIKMFIKSIQFQGIKMIIK